jgi:hypothetical protein
MGFRLLLKDAIEGEVRTSRGIAFQTVGAAKRKDREQKTVLDVEEPRYCMSDERRERTG